MWRLFASREIWKLVATGLLVASAIFHFQSGRPGDNLLDYGSFWESGRAVNEGADPYGIYQKTHRPLEPPYANPNLNPPVSLLLFSPLARFDAHSGHVALWWGGLVIFAVLSLFLLWRYRPTDSPLIAAWMLAIPAVWSSLSLGQVYILLLIPAIAAWVLMEAGRPVLGGLFVGLLAAFKPNLLVWPVLLFFGGYRREAAVAALSFAGFSALPAVLFGPEIYMQWIDVVANDDPIRRAHFVNASLSGIAMRLGVPAAGIAVAGALLLVAAYLVWKIPASRQQVGALAIALSIVASPLAWFHYLLFLLPPLLAAQHWRLATVIGCGMLVVPLGIVGWSGVELYDALPGMPWVSGITMQSFYSWAALAIAVGLARDFPAPGIRGSSAGQGGTQGTSSHPREENCTG
jgi:hypothetical protein